MNDEIWKALAFMRMAVECEILRQENAQLRQQLEASKGPRAVETPPQEASDASVPE